MNAELVYWVDHRKKVWVFATLGDLSDALCFASLDTALDFHLQREEMAAHIYHQLEQISARLDER